MPTLDFPTLPIPTGNKLRTNPTRRRLTNEQAAALQLEYRRPGVTTAYLGQKYGISQQSAYRIATGKHYAELPTAPISGPNLNWVDPPVRRRGRTAELEVKRLVNILKSNAGQWALIKKTVRRPQVDYWLNHGVEAESRKLPTGDWGVYVRWPADHEALVAS